MRRTCARGLPTGVLLATLACVTPTAPDATAPLWRAPPPPSRPDELRIEPHTRAAAVGTPLELRVEGRRASDASCSWPGGESRGSALRLPAARQPGILSVVCRSGPAEASAQITFTDASRPPVADPYAGGVVLFKTRRRPALTGEPVGQRATGLDALDALLRQLDAWALPVFPFDRGGEEDRVGLDRWLAFDLPPEVNFYQAVTLLRACPDLWPQSYLPDDGAFRRVQRRESWPRALAVPRGRRLEPAEPAWTPARAEEPPPALSWELEAIGAASAWKHQDGSGVQIAVIDTGVDANHLALAANLRSKEVDRSGADGDGNGLPGDELGVNFAHLAIAHGEGGPPQLALGLVSDVSDWFRVGTDAPWGHGTALAAIAAGTGEGGGRRGVAPRAGLLVVDVEENHRVSASRLLDEDPRMQPAVPGTDGDALRSPTWARAAGMVYAVAEGAQVVTCAWPGDAPHWLLHDALLYAEDNCAIPVCAERPGSGDFEAVGYPVAWGERAGASAGRGSGDLYDAWTGARQPHFFERPLLGMLVVGPVAAETAIPGASLSDFEAPAGRGPDGGSVTSAVSNPRNDHTPLPDRRSAEFEGELVAAGLVAGSAALLRAQRPDLEPWAVRDALLETARGSGRTRRLDLAAAIEHVRGQPAGSCRSAEERLQRAGDSGRPWWRRVRVRMKLEPWKEPGGPVPPASPAELP